jgi:hypothetical protein
MPRLRVLVASCLNVSDAAVAALPDFPALRELMPMDVPMPATGTSAGAGRSSR